jgi:hypothetical protein
METSSKVSPKVEALIHQKVAFDRRSERTCPERYLVDVVFKTECNTAAKGLRHGIPRTEVAQNGITESVRTKTILCAMDSTM